ncbi:MAG: hypothetical protein MUO31_10240 [Thermodesulfovibrionales bacterium]|nr:hypothetical protein [Thermodesulfovibrionales bacterium]
MKFMIILIMIILMCFMANAETYIACTNGNQIDYFNLDGMHLLTHRLKYKPDFIPEISNGKILYSLNSKYIIVEDIGSIKRIGESYYQAPTEEIPLEIDKKDILTMRPQTQISIDQEFSCKKHIFKDHYLYLINLNFDVNKILFTAVGKESLERPTLWGYKDLIEFNTLWKYDVKSKELKLIFDNGNIYSSFFIDNKILFSTYMDLFIIDSLKGIEKITQQVWAESESSFNKIKKGQLYLVKNIKKNILLTLHEFNDGRNLVGMVEFDLNTKKVRDVMKFDYFKRDFYFNTTIKDVTEDFRYLLLKSRARNEVLLIDLVGNKEYIISNNMDENASFINCLPNDIFPNK